MVEATPGVRARLPRPLGDGRIAYVADHDGDEALFIKEIAGRNWRVQPACRRPAEARRRSPAAPAARPRQGPQPPECDLPLPVSAAGLGAAAPG